MTSWLSPCENSGMQEILRGQKIAIFNQKRQELGEGTFIRRTQHKEMDMTAYECEEHTILARGDHYLRVEGKLHFVQSGLAR
jgi:hypothetical protein